MQMLSGVKMSAANSVLGCPDIGDVTKAAGAAEKCGGHVREQESAAVSV
jgi:hypothetical protein